MIELRSLTIDNGGSEIRVLPAGKTVKEGLVTYTNDFVTIQEKDFRHKDVEDKLGLCRVLNAPSVDYLGIVAVGMTGKQYVSRDLSLSNQTKKTESGEYYRQFIYAIARDAIVEANKKKEEASNKFATLGEFEFDYLITTLIPVKEHSGIEDCSKILREKLSGNYEVEFPLAIETLGTTKVKFRLVPENIHVTPEGAIAITGLRKVLQPEDYTLIVDIGKVTMDISLFKGKVMFANLVRSSSFAGATLNAAIRNALSDIGIAVNEDGAKVALSEGRARKGAQWQDVKQLVVDVKKNFVSNFVIPEIQELLSLAGIGVSQIQYFVPIGAPMNTNEGCGCIVRSIVTECGLNDAEIKYLSDNLRYVNIEQASAITNVIHNKMTKVAIG